jgi:hypothetical protein
MQQARDAIENQYRPNEAAQALLSGFAGWIRRQIGGRCLSG